MRVVCDIETDGLENCSKIFVCVCKDIETGNIHIFRENNSTEAAYFFSQCEQIIGHNFINFDSHWLNKLWKCDIKLKQIVDTLVLARLADSSSIGEYSLRKLGKKIGSYKTYNDDFSRWSEEMEEYCIQDVEVTHAVYKDLQRKLQGFSKECIKLEHNVQALLEKQKRYGFKLDIDLAMETIRVIDDEYFTIIKQLQQLFPPRKLYKGEYIPKYKQDGTLTSVSERIITSNKVEKIGDKYFKIEWKEFNIDSPTEIVERLKPYWEPTQFTPGGQPKICEKNLDTLFDDAPKACKLIKRCKILKSRRTLIQSFIDACGNDGRVHGNIISIGTITHRMAHNKPNTANIPSTKSLYGKECRQMFTVNNGRKLVGCDAAGIQLRALAHYLNDEEITNQILSGDIHWYLAQVYGYASMSTIYDEHLKELKRARDTGKTTTFSILMGAGNNKVGLIAGGDAELGKEIMENLASRLAGWSKLKKRLKASANRGYLMSIDGRKIPVKSAHFAMSVLLQSFEQAIIKWAMVECEKRCRKAKLDSHQVAIVHDEFQRDTLEEHSKEVGEIMRQCIIDAGKHYNTNIPMDGEYKIGNNWLETH